MAFDKIQISSFNEKDVENIVPIHIRAFKGYMNAGMGKRYVEEFLSWFLTYPQTITLKASDGKTIYGYVVGAPIGYDEFINKKLLKFAIIGAVTHPFVLLHKNFVKVAVRKLALVFSKSKRNAKMKNPEGKGISLVGIGTDPQFSGQGIGKELMLAFEKKARELKMDFMRLSVYDYNLKAINVYEKSGWKKLDKRENVFYYYKTLNNN